MNNKKDFTKFTKRNVHKRRSKEEARRELLRAIREVGVEYEGVKLRDIHDGGRGEKKSTSRTSRDVLTRGIYSGSKSDFGFVSLEEGGQDVFIPGGKSGGAIDGDFVEIVYHKFTSRDGGEKTEGRVLKIIEYGRHTVIGTLEEEVYRHGRRSVRYLYVSPDDPKVMLKPRIRDSFSAVIGDKVEALIRRDGTSHPECDVIRVFGDSESKEANYAAILSECGIVTEFTPDELALAEEVSREEISFVGRVDRTSEIIFTIDGAGAKDLDDAISLRKLPGGKWRLGVHIADVSHYVRERTALDRCVMARGTSVYFTDKVVPMLPESLSNGSCSLNAGENKYTLSAIVDLDSTGNITDVKIEPSVIRSRIRGVYSEVNRLLSGTADSGIKKKYAGVLPTLKKMEELYYLLLEKSKKRGSVDFDSDEAEILLSEDGVPVDIVRRERGVSERIIEQFMLAANEAVATFLYSRSVPCVYRIHEAPPKEGFGEFLGYLRSLGFDTSSIPREEPSSHDLAKILDEAERRGCLSAVSYTMLRSMAKAKYSAEKTPHFGLGIDTYCHFTSPIRRLSDLATHRIIRRVLFEDKRAASYASYANRAAAAATEGELRAVNAERRIENLYKVIYMSEYIGETFEASINSITSFGIFCTLDNTCEGLVPISEMPGVFTFDETNLTMRSRDKIYRIADRITICVEEANITRGKLRFSIVEK